MVDDSGSIAVNDDPERLEMIAQRSKARRQGQMSIGGANSLFPDQALLDQLNENQDPNEQSDVVNMG